MELHFSVRCKLLRVGLFHFPWEELMKVLGIDRCPVTHHNCPQQFAGNHRKREVYFPGKKYVCNTKWQDLQRLDSIVAEQESHIARVFNL